MRSTMILEATHKSGNDLPVDVLRMIGSHLLAKDCISFRSVCRTWRFAITALPSPQLVSSLTKFLTLTRFPLLMYYGRDGSSRTFYHPIYNTTYVIDTPKLANARILFSKDGWLIMARGTEIFFFFFNPIMNKRIDLPDIPDIRFSYITISFSSLPTLPDCVVFCVLWSFQSSHRFNFIRRGESEWTSCKFYNNTVKFDGSLSNPVFHNGAFYYLDQKGLLGTFDHTQGDDENSWTVLAKPQQPCNSIFRNYLVECDGDLISVFLGRHGKWVKIFKLDTTTMTWKKLENLGDKMLFVSQTTSLSKLEINGMGNNIFFPRLHGKNGGIVFYSLNTCKFHTLGSGYNRPDYYNTTLKLFCTWVDPASSHIFLDDEFQW